MDLELGLKITHSIDDHASSTNLRIAKDKSSPLFVSKETESTFILTAYLKGYRRERIHIDINEDGTQICISGEKPVQEKVMLGWIMYKKEVEMRGFRKVFRIPDGVVLDRIRAKFNEHESTLTIVMPKSVQGIRGVGIEEVKEEGVVDIGGQQMPQPSADEVAQKESFRSGSEEEHSPIKGKGIGEEAKRETLAGEGLQKDIRRGKTNEEAEDSKIQSMKETPKSGSENSEEPKVASFEEADRIEKEKVDRKELETEEMVVTEKAIKEDNTTEATPEVAKPLDETRPTEPHTEKGHSELPKLDEQMMKQNSPEAEKEMRKAGLEERVDGRPERGESSTPEGDIITSQQEAQVHQEETTDEISNEGDVQLPHQEPPRGLASYQNGEIEEAAQDEEHIKGREVDERESSEIENCNDVVEKLSDHLEKARNHLEKTPGLEKSNLLCSPFIIAGSALIVSLVMLAINRIRTRKR